MATFQAQYTVPSNGSQITVLSGQAINSSQVNIRNTGTVALYLGPPIYQGPPANFAAAPVQTGGTFASGATVFWKITSTNALGESLPSTQVTTSFSYPSSTGSATLTWTQVTGATGYKIYRYVGTTPVWNAGSLLVTTIGSGATVTYTDTNSAASAGQPPISNTATLPALWPFAVNDYLGLDNVEPDDILVAQVQSAGTAGQVTILGIG